MCFLQWLLYSFVRTRCSHGYGVVFLLTLVSGVFAADADDFMRELQKQAVEQKQASWGHWGKDATKFSTWTNHSNRLIPIYTFGIGLEQYTGDNSLYRDPQKIESLYGYVPKGTVNSRATYMDQTDVYRLQQDAIRAGKKHVILFIFDGMDWQTTQAAAIYKSGKVYTSGRGSGLAFQDYDAPRPTITGLSPVPTTPVRTSMRTRRPC